MEFEFNPDLDYQIEAIDAVTEVFDGQPDTKQATNLGFQGHTVPNELRLSDEAILQNLQKVQSRNGIDPVDRLYTTVEGESVDLLNFSVDMETGTGKTYVYLRTIHELYRNYGWKKFIILVPSVAIREGVVKTIEQTTDHFGELYSRPPFNWAVYDSSNLSDVIRFGNSDQIEVLVLTLQSINKGEDNVMFRPHDKLSGDRPVDRLAGTNPILIMDEPQNMEGEKSKEAISSLSPAFSLRYSATHRRIHNKVYELTPVDAHRRGLVKTIEVLSVTQDDDYNKRYLRALSFDSGPKAKIELYKQRGGDIQVGKKTVRAGDSLHTASGGVDVYEGINVVSIDARREHIEFSDGTRLSVGESTDTDVKTIQHRQITETIREHFDKAKRYHEQGIKVLSLFFIDRVDHFRGRSGDEVGHLWEAFCEAFNDLKREDEYAEIFEERSPEQVAGAYFATTNSGDVKIRESSIRDDVESYELIMQDKEQLLSFDEDTQFIFSHSALQEGWDNPNVFQICTLNNTVSEVKKRQEIGRGVRLPVRQDGSRLPPGDSRNLLTIVANQSYADYAAALQEEYEETTGYGDDIETQTKNRRDRTTVQPDWSVINGSADFAQLWARISSRTKYRTNIETDALIEEIVDDLKAIHVREPKLRVQRGELSIDSTTGVKAEGIAAHVEDINREGPIPNVVQLLAEKTDLTRRTIARTLAEADVYDSISKNPHDFVTEARDCIERIKSEHIIDRIEYTRTGESFTTDVFSEIQTYEDNTIDVRNSVYDKVLFDSEGEREFAGRLDRDASVPLFIKLPKEYRIPTPIGSYTPDWAILYRREDALSGADETEERFLIRETKFGDEENLRPRERMKIECAREHYETLGVDFDTATDFSEDDLLEDILRIR